jgi:hypothetical protein
MSFPTNTMVSIVDFIENYSFEVRNKVQSTHWHIYQISILVHIYFCHNPTPDLYDEKSQILTEHHFYVYDNRKHDYKFVQHYFKLHWQYMSDREYAPQWHWVWNDGCVIEFKSNKPWFFVPRYPSMIKGCKQLWNFFGNGHGTP